MAPLGLLKRLIKDQGNQCPGSLLLNKEAQGGIGALAQGREAFPSVATKFPKDSEERKVAIHWEQLRCNHESHQRLQVPHLQILAVTPGAWCRVWREPF